MNLPATEDAFVRALNPTGRRLPAYDPYYADDIADLGERPGRMLERYSLADDREAVVFLAADSHDASDAFLWTRVDGRVAAHMGAMNDFVEVVTAAEFRGLGLGTMLFKHFVKRFGLVDMGGFTEEGERAARRAYRSLVQQQTRETPRPRR